MTSTIPPNTAPAPEAGPLHPALAIGTAALALPFDALRLQYGAAVVLGLAPRSMLAAARVERFVGALEAATLGPFARRV